MTVKPSIFLIHFSRLLSSQLFNVTLAVDNVQPLRRVKENSVTTWTCHDASGRIIIEAWNESAMRLQAIAEGRDKFVVKFLTLSYNEIKGKGEFRNHSDVVVVLDPIIIERLSANVAIPATIFHALPVLSLLND